MSAASAATTPHSDAHLRLDSNDSRVERSLIVFGARCTRGTCRGDVELLEAVRATVTATATATKGSLAGARAAPVVLARGTMLVGEHPGGTITLRLTRAGASVLAGALVRPVMTELVAAVGGAGRQIIRTRIG
jgi:hypothetical protein